MGSPMFLKHPYDYVSLNQGPIPGPFDKGAVLFWGPKGALI